MELRHLSRMKSFGITDEALRLVLGYIDDPRDRDAISLVCRKWFYMDAVTRKHVTIAICYSTTPDRLAERFSEVVSLKIKGKPRAAMFDLIPEDWGGYAGPWIKEMISHHAFACLRSLHLRRMIVSDAELEALALARGDKLAALKLDRCSGFSTHGLKHVARYCRKLKTLFLEESIISDHDGNWLHELAANNTVLETLNFYLTELVVSFNDLELIARKCPLLKSLKISDCDILDLVDFLSSVKMLEEFGGGSFNNVDGLDVGRYNRVTFPSKISRLGLTYMGSNEMHILFPYARSLKKLDLQYTFLSMEDHCHLIQQCPCLEILEVRNVIGDKGLEVVAKMCKRLRRLRVEQGDDNEQGHDEEQGKVSHRGLSSIAQGCPLLENLAVHVSDINNAALEQFGTFSKYLQDFRIVLLDAAHRVTELPLDNGVRALLRGCTKLTRFGLYLRQGGLSDVGMSYIGQYSANIRYMLLGCVGDSDRGLLELSGGCPMLQKLEMRGCCFSERALAMAVTKLTSLRYIWVQSQNAFTNGSDLLAMARPYWNIEIIPPMNVLPDSVGRDPDIVSDNPPQVLAYYSLAGQRNDYPETVIPLYPLPSE